MIEHYKKVLKNFGAKAFCADVLFSIAHRLGFNIVEKLYLITESPDSQNMNEGLDVSVNSDDAVNAWRINEKLTEQHVESIRLGKTDLVSVKKGSRYVAFCLLARGRFLHSGNILADVKDGYRCEYGTWIDPECRGSGLRSVLIRAALDYVKKSGGEGIIASINLDNHVSKKSAVNAGYHAVTYVWYHRRFSWLCKQSIYYKLESGG